MKLSTPIGDIGNKIGYKKAINLISKSGFDAFDLSMYSMHIKPNQLSGDNYLYYLKELKEEMHKLGIECNQAHAPFPTQLNGNDEYNQMTLKMIIRSMECAAFLGAKVIVVHPIKNSSSSLCSKYAFVKYESKQQLFDANINFFKKLIPYCQKFNIKIAVENMWERHPMHHDTLIPAFLGNSEEHARFIDVLDSEWIVGCLDIGHALICGENPAQAIRRLGAKRLQALHIHDCNGYEDSHALPFSMPNNWDEIMNALAEICYNGDFTFEAENFYKYYPEELYSDALTFMCKMGRYMINSINNKCLGDKNF